MCSYNELKSYQGCNIWGQDRSYVSCPAQGVASVWNWMIKMNSHGRWKHPCPSPPFWELLIPWPRLHADWHLAGRLWEQEQPRNEGPSLELAVPAKGGSCCVSDFLATSLQRDKPQATAMEPCMQPTSCGSASEGQAHFDNSFFFLKNGSYSYSFQF